MASPIPAPPGLPLLGNLLDIKDEIPIRGIEKLADIYGPIYKLRILGQERIFISSHELMEEVCDERRFYKVLPPGLQNSKVGGASGLFTAPDEADPDWGQAHRILMPAFGPLSVTEMFDEMHDIASQLVLKWARNGEDYKIHITEDFTRLTLDTIALCAMDFRFNSFYQDEMHPFVTAMNHTLEARTTSTRPLKMLNNLVFGPSEKIKADRKYMEQVAAQLVQHRRENPTDKKDLLNAMLHGKDPKTGKVMRDELIAANMITFLIAGHETTSGLLSFAFFNLLKNPDTYFKAQEEVDRVIGKGKITVDHLKDLKYLNAVMRETLRLTPTVPAFTRQIRAENKDEPVTIGKGQYLLDRNTAILVLVGKAHRDPKVYGDDANEFRPERMLDDAFDKLPNAAWKPFGTGVRACIGRSFAWQEALLISALILQNLNLRLDDPNYELKIKQALTIKPKDLYMRATLREGRSATALVDSMASSNGNGMPKSKSVPAAVNGTSHAPKALKDMTILYGSNSGTCQSLAQRLASSAGRCGFRCKVMDLDSAVQKLPKGQPLVVVTASYDGQPTDNAKQFLAWLQALNPSSKTAEGVEFAVFGCGHSDWTTTYQRIPTLVDEALAAHGGNRIIDRGSANVAKGDVYGDFDSWSDAKLLAKLAPSSSSASETGISSGSDVDIEISVQGRASHLGQDVYPAKVLSTRSLTAQGEPEKRHMEVLLPSEMTYECGDYLAILPLNPDVNVQRVFARYGLPWDAEITINSGGPTTLPEHVPLSAYEVFRGYVELGLPATEKDIRICISLCADQSTNDTLSDLTKAYKEEILAKRVTLIDLLTAYPAIILPLGNLLSMLPPMRPRHYSISSSPLHKPEICSITHSVINEDALSGQGKFIGVSGSYLCSLKPGDAIQVSVRSTNKHFRLPVSSSTSINDGTPIMMFGAGTGLAPFRGFLQERAVKLAAGTETGKPNTLPPALLFLGCRSETRDRLYADEIDEWVKLGVVDMRYAFSREAGKSQGCKYIQDRMLKDKADVVRLWEQGAKVFLCGNPGLVESVGLAARQILREKAEERGIKAEKEDVEKWFAERRNARFVSDVFI